MRTWKGIVSVTVAAVLIFVFGALAGGVVAHKSYAKRMQEMSSGPAGMRQVMLRGLRWRLKLSPSQVVEVDRVIRDAQKDLLVVRSEVQPRIEEVLDRSIAEIRGQLDEVQRVKFDKLIEEHRARLRNRQLD